MHSILRSRLAVTLVSVAVACAAPRVPAGSGPEPGVETAVPAVLARFAAEPAIVLPVALVAGGDSLGWRAAAGGDRTLVTMADTLLEATFRGRGLTQWTYAGALTRAARRNPTYLVDPSTLRPAFALRAALRRSDRALADPLASQLRAFAGTTGARYAMLPGDLEFRPDPAGGGGRARLTIGMVDVRLAQVLWVGSIAGDVQRAWSPAVLSSLIDRAADLVVPR